LSGDFTGALAGLQERIVTAGIVGRIRSATPERGCVADQPQPPLADMTNASKSRYVSADLSIASTFDRK